MCPIPTGLTPETWLAQIFSSQEALRGGVVKRKIRDVERLVGRPAFLREVERRGFRVVENRAHFVIFCNQEPIRICAGSKPLGSGLVNRFRNRLDKVF